LGARALKRSFDLVLALVLILLTLPLMMVIALAIEAESPGPLFFAHRRIGQGGSEFGLIKFRTMVRDAQARLQTHLEAHPAHMAEWNERFKLRNDPRITRVGRILRRTSLDELPQLFNVLVGTLSLTGPRAIVREEVARFGAYAPMILSIKPGMTGLWAVSGRSEVSQRERALLEYRYVIEWSFLLDLRILVRTIPAVLRGHGAY
jgi:undecaprenyl-phosphate galactose phosphotransferase